MEYIPRRVYTCEHKLEAARLVESGQSIAEATCSLNISQQIREKIDRCSVTVVYLSERVFSSKLVSWEIGESIKHGTGVIRVYIGGRGSGLRTRGVQAERL